MIETFQKDSPFLIQDNRKNRWAIPYNYDALNARVENLIIQRREFFQNKKILDLGCHFGTMMYACLSHGALSVTGIDSEEKLLQQGIALFESHDVSKEHYSFMNFDVLQYLMQSSDNAFDTILCLGLFYYIHDQYLLLKEMMRVARYGVILDTFTAYFGACMSKEGMELFSHTSEDTYTLPLIFMPLTKADKGDYTLKDHVKKGEHKKKWLSITSLPTIPALENYFTVLDIEFERIDWTNYIQTNSLKWSDFVSEGVKRSSHWADVYETEIRVSYILKK